MKTVLAMLGLAALVIPSVASAERLRGDNFITVMGNNTLTAKNEEGVRYHIFFLPGGQVTYQDRTGKEDHGTWTIDRSGDVCITWSSLMAGKQNCYQVSVDKNTITWGNKDSTMHGGLLGGVQAVEMEKKP